MKQYLKLVNFEVNRFIKIYAVLIAITIVSQLTGVFSISSKYVKNAKEVMGNSSMTTQAFIEQYGEISFNDIMYSGWFIGPIAICVAALLFYVFLIWYRDWFGKNTFVYRLLMLPTARLNVYFAKATTIFITVLGLISVQLLLLPLENALLKYLVPIEFRFDFAVTEIIGSSPYLALFSPLSFFDFSIHYLIGFLFVFVVFTALLFERSYGVFGILMGAIYSAISFAILISPLIVTGLLERAILYPMEYFILEIMLMLIILASSLFISRFLLNKKITV